MTSLSPTTEPCFKVGDVLVSRWGIDQDNIDFYQVVHVTPKMVEVAPIGDRVLQETGFLGQVVEPVPDEFLAAPCRRKVRVFRGRPWVMATSQLGAWLWDGEPCVRTFTH